MKDLIPVFLVLLLLTAQKSLAVSSACTLLQMQLPSDIRMTEEELSTYRQKLQTECRWQQAYTALKNELSTKYNISPEQISEYQAMRFIRRGDFENSKAKEIPVELTYQIKREQYNLPNDQKSPVIWDNWSKGILQLNNLRQALLNGEYFTFAKLVQAHINFFQLSDEVGDDGNPPDLGVMKPAVMNDNYWWELSTAKEAADAKAITKAINDHYRSMGLLPRFSEEKLNLVIDVRQALKRQPPENKNVIAYVWTVFSGASRANQTHLQNILQFVKSIMTQALNNQPLLWNNKAMTPAEAAFLAQKFYVGVHPFSEGNGRTGRLMQELILTAMDMPHGSSGDLMDYDVLTTFPDYYSRAMQSNLQLMQKMKTCLEIYETNAPALLVNSDQLSIKLSSKILNNTI